MCVIWNDWLVILMTVPLQVLNFGLGLGLGLRVGVWLSSISLTFDDLFRLLSPLLFAFLLVLGYLSAIIG